MTRHYVSFSAPVTPQSAQALQATFAQLVNGGATEVYLMLSTPGGSVSAGITAHNFLRALPIKLTTHNIGAVDSIGNVIFLAGEERFTCASATFMFHGVGFDTPAGTRLEEKMLRERLDGIQADQAKIGSIITDRTKITPEEVRELFFEAKTRDPSYALSKGIVDDVRDVNVPRGTPIHQLVFK